MNDLSKKFLDLVDIIAALRHPETGCPWDKEQTHESLKPYIIEESYEVLQAIDESPETLSKELGDVLLQVLLHSQVSKDSGGFDIEEVITKLSEKLISRHPHVFGDLKAKNSQEALKNWEQIKQTELKDDESILDGVPKAMPALLRAQRLGEKASRVGFDWTHSEDVKEKVLEELHELSQANSPEATFEELGDLLFALTQYSRHLNIDAEAALHSASKKFTGRFKKVELLASKNHNSKDLKTLSADQLDKLWIEAKK